MRKGQMSWILVAVLLGLSIGSHLLVAQTPGQIQQQQQPIELPEFVITGKEKINIPASSKQEPEPTNRLTKQELDSLNVLEKASPATLKPPGLPALEPVNPLHSGYLRAEAGQFWSPLVEGTYRFQTGGFAVSANGFVNTSAGHTRNAEFSDLRLGARAVYVAPEKYIFFGGSRTSSEVNVQRRGYRLFALANPTDREVLSVEANTQTVGVYDQFQYTVGAGLQHTALGSVTDLSETRVHGHMSARKDFADILAGARLFVDMGAVGGTTVSFIEALANAEYRQGNVRLSGDAGIQAARNSDGSTLGAPKLVGKLEYLLSKNLTVRARTQSGLVNNSLAGLLGTNAYVTDTLLMSFERTSFELAGDILYHPNEKLQVSVGLLSSVLRSGQYFESVVGGVFSPTFANMSKVEINTEALYSLSGRTQVSARAQLLRATLEAGGEQVPFIPSVFASAGLVHRWTHEIGSQVNVTYVGERRVSQIVDRTIDGYIDLSLSGEYRYSSTLSFEARITNLLNSNIYIWDAYRERGIFFALGAMWRL